MTTVSIDLVDGAARATVLESGGYLRPLLLGTEGPCARIALVGVCATLLADDDVRLHIEVGSGVHLELVEPSGMVAYDARGGSAHWTADVHVGTGGSLIWRAAPFVVSDGADVRRRTEIALADEALALVSETLVLGRSHEDGGQLRSSMRATRARRELLVEELDLRSPERRAAPGMLGDSRVLATVALLGTSPPEPATPAETLLAGPGSLARALARHAHEADEALRTTWSAGGASSSNSPRHRRGPARRAPLPHANRSRPDRVPPGAEAVRADGNEGLRPGSAGVPRGGRTREDDGGPARAHRRRRGVRLAVSNSVRDGRCRIAATEANARRRPGKVRCTSRPPSSMASRCAGSRTGTKRGLP